MNLASINKSVNEILNGTASNEQKRVTLLGRKGLVTTALRALKDLPAAEKRTMGAKLNTLKKQIEEKLEPTATTEEVFDLSLPPADLAVGSTHPISQAINRSVEIFAELGFTPTTGTEIVTDDENFGLLHFPANHPARDVQDSFLLDDLPELLLRTQTSAAQVPIMSKNTPPMRVLVPGKTFRREIDATHQPMFHQVEGFIVDEQVTFADLKGILTYFVESFFGQKVKMRFRPHHFPFTEPSAEIDILWQKEDGSSRWLEILGCGCIHPVVLQNARINPKKYQGVAFGFGVERLVMLRHRIDHMKALSSNDEALLRQFSIL